MTVQRKQRNRRTKMRTLLNDAMTYLMFMSCSFKHRQCQGCYCCSPRLFYVVFFSTVLCNDLMGVFIKCSQNIVSVSWHVIFIKVCAKVRLFSLASNDYPLAHSIHHCNYWPHNNVQIVSFTMSFPDFMSQGSFPLFVIEKRPNRKEICFHMA